MDRIDVLAYLPPLRSVGRKGQGLVFIKCLVDARLFKHFGRIFTILRALLFILQMRKLKPQESGLL